MTLTSSQADSKRALYHKKDGSVPVFVCRDRLPSRLRLRFINIIDLYPEIF